MSLFVICICNKMILGGLRQDAGSSSRNTVLIFSESEMSPSLLVPAIENG
jgi:hypothetical protein